MTDLAQAMIEHFEGCRLTAYRDSRGLWTIGWGHLLNNSVDWTGHTITQELADSLLEQDMDHARQLAQGFPHYPDMNDVRQAVCVSMCFQMGQSPLYWPNFTTALQARDFAGAAQAGLDSDWAKQTPQRAVLEMDMMESGVWELPQENV